jgi:hypothetical protein
VYTVMNGIFDIHMKKFSSSLFFYHDNCHSDHLFVYLMCRGNIDIDCGDTIDTNRVARVGRKTNDALIIVNGKLQDISYPLPRYDSD